MNLYEQYRDHTFDLTAFGIERGEGRSDYFCTPQGAEIIGWTGVDGVHYCTVKRLGETVFAVEPMGDAGRHTFPVAANFADFLRLLMACGHEAYLEQAHAWSRERYDRFAAENPSAEEAREQSACLQSAYGLTPMEDPYAYLKHIYDHFDFTTVPYKKDYYEYIPRESMPLPKEWKVYFSLHDRKGGERAGEELPLNAAFSWAGYEWTVPAAYICAKGLVLDLFAEADSERTNEFLFKWTYAAEDETMLTAEERHRLEQENPMNLDFDASLTVNGKRLEEKQGQGSVWAQGFEACRSEAMRDMLDHYGLSFDKCWIWRRVSFPWATKTKPTVKTLELCLVRRPLSIMGECFTVTEAGQQISFLHPVTKCEHTLTVTDLGGDKLSRMQTLSDGYEHPAYCTKMAYTLEPDLLNAEFSVSDTRQSDPPKATQKTAPQYDFVSVMTIIGGADGPSAVCLGVPQTPKRLHAACSALTFEPQERVEWRMTFRVKTVEDLRVCLKGGSLKSSE